MVKTSKIAIGAKLKRDMKKNSDQINLIPTKTFYDYIILMITKIRIIIIGHPPSTKKSLTKLKDAMKEIGS